MRCFLVRHAQTIWNGENRLQGHSDLPLSPLGLEQAKRVGAYFRALREAGVGLRRLYVSHLQRSQQTAQAIGSEIGLAPTIEPAFAEIGLGQWEGLTPEEIDARFAGAYEQWKTTPSMVSIPGAEPLALFRARVRQAFTAMLTAHQKESGDLVVVTHGGVIASLLADCVEADYDRFLRGVSLENAGVSAVNCRHVPPVVMWVNATTHLTSADDRPLWMGSAGATSSLPSSPSLPVSSSRPSQP